MQKSTIVGVKPAIANSSLAKMKRSSRRKTLSHSQIENFLSDMSVTGTNCLATGGLASTVANIENINANKIGIANDSGDDTKKIIINRKSKQAVLPPAVPDAGQQVHDNSSPPLASRTRSSNVKSHQKNLQVDTMLHDEVQNIRDFCKAQFETISIVNGDRPIRKSLGMSSLPDRKMIQFAKNVLTKTKYPLCSSRLLCPEQYLHPIHSLEAKKTLLLSLSPMLTEAEQERQKEVAACENFTRCRSSRSKGRNAPYEYADFDMQAMVTHPEYEKRYMLYVSRNKRTYDKGNSSFSSTETYLTHRIFQQYAQRKRKERNKSSQITDMNQLAESTTADSTAKCTESHDDKKEKSNLDQSDLFAEDADATIVTGTSETSLNLIRRLSMGRRASPSNPFATVRSASPQNSSAVRRLSEHLRKNDCDEAVSMQDPNFCNSVLPHRPPAAPPSRPNHRLNGKLTTMENAVSPCDSSGSDQNFVFDNDIKPSKDRKRKQLCATAPCDSADTDFQQHVRTVERRGTLSPASVRKMLMEAACDDDETSDKASEEIVELETVDMPIPVEVVDMVTDEIPDQDDDSDIDRTKLSRRTSYELPPALSPTQIVATLLSPSSDKEEIVPDSISSMETNMEVESFGRELDELLFDDDEDENCTFRSPVRKSLDYTSITESLATLVPDSPPPQDEVEVLSLPLPLPPPHSSDNKADDNSNDDYSQVDEFEHEGKIMMDATISDVQVNVGDERYVSCNNDSSRELRKENRLVKSGPFDLPSPQKHYHEEAHDSTPSALVSGMPTNSSPITSPCGNNVESKPSRSEKKSSSRMTCISRLSPQTSCSPHVDQITESEYREMSPKQSSSGSSAALLSHVNCLLSDSPTLSPSTMLKKSVSPVMQKVNFPVASISASPKTDNNQLSEEAKYGEEDRNPIQFCSTSCLFSKSDDLLDDSLDEIGVQTLDASTDLATFELLESIVEDKYSNGSLSPVATTFECPEPATVIELNDDNGGNRVVNTPSSNMLQECELFIPNAIDMEKARIAAEQRMEDRIAEARWKCQWEIASCDTVNKAIMRMKSSSVNEK